MFDELVWVPLSVHTTKSKLVYAFPKHNFSLNIKALCFFNTVIESSDSLIFRTPETVLAPTKNSLPS